jgi:hypothetical protein
MKSKTSIDDVKVWIPGDGLVPSLEGTRKNIEQEKAKLKNPNKNIKDEKEEKCIITLKPLIF